MPLPAGSFVYHTMTFDSGPKEKTSKPVMSETQIIQILDDLGMALGLILKWVQSLHCKTGACKNTCKCRLLVTLPAVRM